MRSAKEQDYFPYTMPTVCYIFVDNDGVVKQVPHVTDDIRQAYCDVVNGSGTLYAVWPGKYRSDIFIIDDLDAFAVGFGLVPSAAKDEGHVHDIEYEVIRNNPRSCYLDIKCTFKCDCDLIGLGIRQIATDLNAQKGWNVSISEWSGSGRTLYLRVRRESYKG